MVDAAQTIVACHLAPGLGAPPRALQDAVAAVTGHALALAPNTRSGDDDAYAVWLDPARWLVVGTMAQRWSRLRALQLAVTTASPEAMASDATDALVMIDIAGARAPALMAMASALDFDSAVFAPPRTARGAFAGVSTVLYRHGDGFRVHADATLIAHVGAWLEQAARLLPRGQ
ncbi:MAG: hypothetical protein IPI73_26025 [Betaproteobacteria bacterium]|nr:hypothetical protein [Betaproteobacteria bacterium]